MGVLIFYVLNALLFVLPLAALVLLFWAFRVVSGRFKVSRTVYAVFGAIAGFMIAIPVSWQLIPSNDSGWAIGHWLPLASVLALTFIGVKQGLRYASYQDAVLRQTASVEGLVLDLPDKRLEAERRTEDD